MENEDLALALKQFAESCNRLSEAIDRRDQKDKARTNKLVSGLAAITMTCVGLVGSGSISSYKTDADLRSHAHEANELWLGAFDSTGKRVRAGQYQWNSDTATNQKELAANQIAISDLIEALMKSNPQLKWEPLPPRPPLPKYSTPDGSQ